MKGRIIETDTPIYDPWDIHNYLVVRVYTPLEKEGVSKEVSNALKMLEEAGCQVIKQMPGKDEVITGKIPQAIAEAEAEYVERCTVNAREQLLAELKNLDVVQLRQIVAIAAAE